MGNVFPHKEHFRVFEFPFYTVVFLMLCKTLKSRWSFDFVFRICVFIFAPKISDSIIFSKKKFKDLPLSNIPPSKPTSSSSTTSTTSTSSIPSTNRRSTGLDPYIYSRLWLFQIKTAASGTKAESIFLLRTSLSFRVQQNIVPLVTKLKT